MPTIKELRERKGLSQRELAKQLGVSSQAIVYWESGKKTPTVQHLKALARLLGATMDEVTFGWETEPEGAQDASEEDQHGPTP